MSRKVEVLEVSGKLLERINKGSAEARIRRLVARRISKWVIQLLEVRPVRPIEAFTLARQMKVPETNTRWDWSEPIAARYPARDQTSYQYGAR